MAEIGELYNMMIIPKFRKIWNATNEFPIQDFVSFMDSLYYNIYKTKHKINNYRYSIFYSLKLYQDSILIILSYK